MTFFFPKMFTKKLTLYIDSYVRTPNTHVHILLNNFNCPCLSILEKMNYPKDLLAGFQSKISIH